MTTFPGLDDPAALNLTFRQGSDVDKTFQWSAAGALVSFAGATFRSQIRAQQLTTSTLLLNVTPYVALNSTDSTTIELHVPGSVTYPLPAGVCFWDLYVDFDSTHSVCLVAGRVTVTNAVSARSN